VTNQHITTNIMIIMKRNWATGNHYFEWYWVGYPNKNGEKNAKRKHGLPGERSSSQKKDSDLLTVGTNHASSIQILSRRTEFAISGMPSAVEWIRGRQWENWEKEIPREAIPSWIESIRRIVSVGRFTRGTRLEADLLLGSRSCKAEGDGGCGSRPGCVERGLTACLRFRSGFLVRNEGQALHDTIGAV